MKKKKIERWDETDSGWVGGVGGKGVSDLNKEDGHRCSDKLFTSFFKTVLPAAFHWGCQVPTKAGTGGAESCQELLKRQTREERPRKIEKLFKVRFGLQEKRTDQSAERQNSQWYWSKEMKSGNFPGARDGIPSTDNTTTLWMCKIRLHCSRWFSREPLQSHFKMTFTIQHYRIMTYRNVYNNIKKKSLSISLSFGI